MAFCIWLLSFYIIFSNSSVLYQGSVLHSFYYNLFHFLGSVSSRIKVINFDEFYVQVFCLWLPVLYASYQIQGHKDIQLLCFIISGLKFRSLIHVVIIFAVISPWTNYISLEWGYPRVTTLFVEKITVLHCTVLIPFFRNQ